MLSWCNGQNQVNIFQKLKPCETHNNPLQFVCFQSSCREHPLLCVECLDEHKEHKWDSLKNFATEDVRQMLVTGDSKTTRRIEEAGSVIATLFLSFREQVAEQISLLEEKITHKLHDLHQNNLVEMPGGREVSQQVITELLDALEKEKSVEWVQNLKTFLQGSIQQAVIAIDAIMDDLNEAVGSEWQAKTHLENEVALKQLKYHLHYHKQKDPNYFQFTSQAKHPGIQLSEDNLEAIFKKNLPSRPVAIASNPIQPKLKKFAFDIIKLDKTAFIFAATTVFIGVCTPATVKAVGMRRISEVGKGAYMIGSSGWSYHHKNPLYDRKDVVGFKFGEGERIQVEVQLDEPGTIHFSKKGIIFKSCFSMPLDLSQREILELKPCVSFDGDEGAIVKLINF